MSSLVPGYMTVSWTVSPSAVGVRATCGVEGRPARKVDIYEQVLIKILTSTHQGEA